MISRHMIGLALVFVFVGCPQTLLAELAETPVASIELERAVHFLTPEEATVVVPPGFYTVEATENGLQLTHGLLPDEGGEAFLLQAKPGTHEEQLDGPIARSIAVEEDAHYLSLLLPDGQSLEVIGSYSGVRPRGEGRFNKFSRKARKKLAAVLSRLEEGLAWNKLCSNRYAKVNDINNCCASKYNSCKRVCRKKGKQRVSCQQQCETLNEGCWIRREAKPNWMLNYCRKKQNQQKSRTKNRTHCCQIMQKKCERSCQAFPKSGRSEICGRCLLGGLNCRTNTLLPEPKQPPQVVPPQEEATPRPNKPLPDSLKPRFKKAVATLEALIKTKGAQDPRRTRYACWLKKLGRANVDDRVIRWTRICPSRSKAAAPFALNCDARFPQVDENDLQKFIKSKKDVEEANRRIFPSFITHLRTEILENEEFTAVPLKNFRQLHDDVHRAIDILFKMKNLRGPRGIGLPPSYYLGIHDWLGDRQRDPKSVLSCR